MQLSVDIGRDDYNAPRSLPLQETGSIYSLDVNYALSDAWSINGYLSAGSQKINQARPAGYILAFDDSSLNAGIGFNGKASERLQLGGTLSYVGNEDELHTNIGANPAAGLPQLLAVTGGLPDIVYRRMELRLFGSYTFTDRSTVAAIAPTSA